MIQSHRLRDFPHSLAKIPSPTHTNTHTDFPHIKKKIVQSLLSSHKSIILLCKCILTLQKTHILVSIKGPQWTPFIQSVQYLLLFVRTSEFRRPLVSQQNSYCSLIIQKETKVYFLCEKQIIVIIIIKEKPTSLWKLINYFSSQQYQYKVTLSNAMFRICLILYSSVMFISFCSCII